ncbi:MAG: hypothetical protein A4E53_00466 [Pelotomaculum sp. PtaB.Bin104]|jgi:hypothetical protein|nr:MAG: hypothetical protein A4E53_00466 [Pelotomaculum sp. PtaB.Bin104]
MEKITRDTNTVLMNKVFELVKENGCYEKAGAIMDYFLAEDYKVQELSDYEFDFLVKLNFGGSEGIYLDCYIEGCFRESNAERKTERLSCGTFKTLDESLDAMKIMGELAGSLTYFASQYVNKELDRYTPTAQREAEEKRRAERAAK